MTTAQIKREHQSQALADGITKAIELGDLEAHRPLADLRAVASPSNSNTVSAVSYAEHAVVAKALRRAAAHYRSAQPEGTVDPVAEQLDSIAGQLDQHLALLRANGGR